MSATSHWARTGESTFVAGVWFLYWVHRLFGRLPFRFCLSPVVFCYWIFQSSARNASLDYLRRLQLARGVFPSMPGIRTSLAHFSCFAETLLDKTLAAAGRYPRNRLRIEGHDVLLADMHAGRGGVIITAHMGCLELMQASANFRPGLRINILVHTAHAQRFNRILARLNPASTVRLLQVSDFSAPVAMMLADRVAAGEMIAIAGDRIPVTGDRTLQVPFLGSPAPFPSGPYLIASLLACPVYLMACLHEGSGYHAIVHKLADRIVLPRRDRMAVMTGFATSFATWLEDRVCESPLDWFNFFPFWDTPVHDPSR